MPLMVDFQLTNSRGLNRIIRCDGLETSAIIVPTVHGEPLLTAQAFYYLEQLECVARMNTDEIAEEHHSSDALLARRCEYILDNYLFAYSAKHPESKLSTKVTEFRYWRYDGELYRGYDQNHTKALALDSLNDETVCGIQNEDYPAPTDWGDWCLINQYTEGILTAYKRAMRQCVRKEVEVRTEAHEYLGTGQHRLRLLSTSPGLLDYDQAMMLENIRIRDVAPEEDSVFISAEGMQGVEGFRLRLETVRTGRSCSSDLLAYYFAGLREAAPIAQFRCFYNVLEYFFESAPIEVGESAHTERAQLYCVVRWVANADDIRKFLDRAGRIYQAALRSQITTSSGKTIRPMGTGTEAEISRWVYDIRCACIHSKATRQGVAAARFVPFSNDEDAVAIAVPLLRWLAVACIEKESG
jgi:hypothetical protein